MLNIQIPGAYCIGLLLSGLVMTAVLPAPVSAAEIRFVRPSVEVPVRRGQGTDYKIIKLVKDGDQVELLTENDAWARIRVGEAEGWMPKRFLSKEAPPVKLVQMLRSENEKIKQKNSELVEELTALKELQSSTGGELTACIAERDTLQAQYQNLEAATADVVAIQNKITETEQEIEDVRATLTAVQQQNSELKRKTSLTWFLAGGGVLLLGWLIGLFTGRSRRKRPSLL